MRKKSGKTGYFEEELSSLAFWHRRGGKALGEKGARRVWGIGGLRRGCLKERLFSIGTNDLKNNQI